MLDALTVHHRHHESIPDERNYPGRWRLGDHPLLGMRQGVQCLSLLCVNGAATSSIASLGGLEVMCEAILANMDQPAKLKGLLSALPGMIDSGVETAAAFLDAGLIDALIAGLKKYPNDSAMASLFMSSLLKLMTSDEAAAELAIKNCAPLILGAKRTHYSDEQLQQVPNRPRPPPPTAADWLRAPRCLCGL